MTNFYLKSLQSLQAIHLYHYNPNTVGDVRAGNSVTLVTLRTLEGHTSNHSAAALVFELSPYEKEVCF